MEPEKISEAVEIYCGMRLEQRRLDRLPESCTPSDSTEAYAVQGALNARLAELGQGPVSGHKIGCTSKVMQEYLKIDQPCSGGIYANTVFHQRGERHHSAYCRPGVECEIAVKLGATLTAEGAPYDKDGVAAAVESCMAAIEVVDDRFIDYPKLELPTMLADDFFNAGCVLGARYLLGDGRPRARSCQVEAARRTDKGTAGLAIVLPRRARPPVSSRLAAAPLSA